MKSEDGTVTNSDSEKAEELNKYFHCVFVKENTKNLPTIDNSSNGHTLSDINISEDTILKLINAVNVNKSCGSDLLHPRVLKELRHVLTVPFSLIFKCSFESGLLVED